MVDADDANDADDGQIRGDFYSDDLCHRSPTFNIPMMLLMMMMHRSEAVLTMMSNAKSVSVADIEDTGINLNQR